MNDSITDFVVSGSALSALDNEVPDYPSYFDVLEAVESIWPAAIAKTVTRYNNLYPANSESENRALAEEHYGEWADIAEHFRYLYERWPAMAAVKTESLREAKEYISSAQLGTPVGQLVEELNDWTGLARDSFADNFAFPLVDGAITTQQAIIEELAVAMIAQEGVLRAGAKDAKSLADLAVTVIESMGTFGVDSEKSALALAGIAVAITGVAGATTSLGVTLGLTSAGISYTSEAIANWSIVGPNMYDVLRQVESAADDLKAQMIAEETAIAESLGTTLSSMESVLAATEAEVLRRLLPHEPLEPSGTVPVPNLTDGEQPGLGGFRPEQ